MSGTFINGLPPASSVSTTDVFPLVQGGTVGTPGSGTTRYATVAQCLANVPPGADSFPVVANIAALRSYSGTAQVIWVAGYYTSSDGGQGLFFLNGGDTTSADNGGTIIVATSGTRWIRDTINAGVYSVKWFGAMPGGSDCTAILQTCITNAVSGGQNVYFPGAPGVYSISSNLTVNGPITIFGDGTTSTIQQTNLTSDVFTITGNWVTIEALQITSVSTQTAGNYISFGGGCSNSTVTQVSMLNHFIGINLLSSFGAIANIENCTCRNGNTTNGAVGIQINAGVALKIINFLHDAATAPYPMAAINVTGCGDVTIRGCQLLHAVRGLLVNPQNGQNVDSLWATDTFFDTCSNYGVLFDGVAGSSVGRCRFLGCWMCSAGIRGVSINNPAAGSVNGIDFINCHVFNNTADGIYLFYGQNYQIVGCEIAGNGQAGISIGSGIGSVNITGNTIGPSGGFGGNEYGVFFGGNNNYVNIVSNLLQGNTTANIQGSSAPGASNIQYNFN